MARTRGGGHSTGDTLFGKRQEAEPLAARMRPASLDEVVGQLELLGPGKPLRDAIERGTLGSIILWGPPGAGKTTIGRLVARYTDREFVPFSAVTEGVPRVREIIAEAESRLGLGRRTILFVDEIHRFNRAQQDAFLAAVESGIVTLIGATTENPSFELNGALLSRTRVFVLKPLEPEALSALLRRALEDSDRGLGNLKLTAGDEALNWLAVQADGDARRALTILEAAAEHVGAGGDLTRAAMQGALQLRVARYDKVGEEHYHIISAYHKALRGSDPQGAFSRVGKLELTPDHWAIDGTLLVHEGKLYFIWSGWEGTENVAQHLYICPMRDPVTPSGPRVRISSPTYAWEKRGSGGSGKLPTINEGPQVLQKGKTTHVIYSAAGSWCDDYCLGRLTLQSGGSPLNPAHWHKHP